MHLQLTVQTCWGTSPECTQRGAEYLYRWDLVPIKATAEERWVLLFVFRCLQLTTSEVETQIPFFCISSHQLSNIIATDWSIFEPCLKNAQCGVIWSGNFFCIETYHKVSRSFFIWKIDILRVNLRGETIPVVFFYNISCSWQLPIFKFAYFNHCKGFCFNMVRFLLFYYHDEYPLQRDKAYIMTGGKVMELPIARKIFLQIEQNALTLKNRNFLSLCSINFFKFTIKSFAFKIWPDCQGQLLGQSFV